MIPRKYIIIAVISLIFLTGLSIFAFFWKDGKNITFTIDYPGAKATISDKGKETPFATITNGSSLRLKKQTYIVTFTDASFSQAPIEVVVDDKTTTITLAPSLSKEKKTEMLASEKTAIDTAIKDVAKNAFTYTEGKRELYHYGEWCTTSFRVPTSAASLDPNIGNPDSGEVYYLVLKKNDNKWKVVAGPHLIITKPDYPDIPDYVINAIDPSRTE